MPTYEFRCPDGHVSEKFYRKIGDAVSELACPICGKTAARILSGGGGLLFKGSGFYLTDYGRNAHRKAGPSKEKSASTSETKEGASPASTEGKSSEGSEAKPAKPAETKPAETKPTKPAKSDS
jgi:putative FmdB family regulatory protein